jgi:PAS domain S-box-containing protein
VPPAPDDVHDFGLPSSLDELIAELPDHLAELIVLVDEDGRILWFNRPAEITLGWERERWIGRNIVEVLHPDELAMAHELLVSARASGPGRKEPVTYRIASEFDTWLPIEAVASNVQLATGRTVLVCSARVAGQARRSEFIAREVDERVQVAFDSAVIGMAQVGLDGRVLKANTSLADQVGTDPVDLHGVALTGLLDPSDRPRVARAVSDCVDTRKPVVLAVSFGPVSRPVDLHLSLVPDWVGEPLYLFVQVVPR